MNSYLRIFTKFGLPSILFLTVFFSFLLGVQEGLIPGFLTGLGVACFASLIFGFLTSETTTKVISDAFRGKNVALNIRLNIKKTFLPFTILLLGAILTRCYETLLLPFLLAVILSISVYGFQSLLLGEYRKAASEGELVGYFAGIMTLIIPFANLYFIFLSIVYGFDISRIMSLLK